MVNNKAKDIILNQIRVEIFLGHNAVATYMALSDQSESLNASHFREILGTVQRQAFDAFVLSLCKLFERPSNRYPNYSIPSTLELLLQGDLSDLSKGIQNPILLEQFVITRIDPSFVLTDEAKVKTIPELILKYFSEECPKTPPRDANELDVILDAVKVLRDKRVAHHEETDISSLSKTDLDGALRLLAFAGTYVNIVGFGFFGFSTEGEVSAEYFQPSRSTLWPGINRMISLLGPAMEPGIDKL